MGEGRVDHGRESELGLVTSYAAMKTPHRNQGEKAESDTEAGAGDLVRCTELRIPKVST